MVLENRNLVQAAQIPLTPNVFRMADRSLPNRPLPNRPDGYGTAEHVALADMGGEGTTQAQQEQETESKRDSHIYEDMQSTSI